MAGDLLEAPPGLSLRHLSRKLTRSIHSKAASDLWKRRAELEDTLRHQWFRNLPGDSPAQPDSYRGHGEWLHCLPSKWETALLDPVFRLGLYPAPGTGQRCGRTPPRGERSDSTSWTHVVDTPPAAPKAYIPEDMIESETCSPSLPSKRPLRPPLSKQRLSLTRYNLMANLPRAVFDPFTGQMSTLLNDRGPSSGSMLSQLRSTQSPQSTVLPRTSPRRARQMQGIWPKGRLQPTGP